MTLSAGFECSDGLVLATDLEITHGGIKRLGPKSTWESTDGKALAIAGAGYYDVLAYACEQVAHAISAKTLEEVLAGARRNLFTVYAQHIHKFYEGNERDEALQLIVGLSGSSSRKLFVSSRSILRRVGPYVFVGYGAELAYFLVKQWWNPNYAIKECIDLARRIMQEVGENVPYVGKRANVTVLDLDGNAKNVFE
jgi:20S proteasome alpha/beta subunit